MTKAVRIRRAIAFFAIVTGAVILDFITKSLAIKYLTMEIDGRTVGKSVGFIKGFCSFVYTENPGAAWGMLADAPWVFMSVSVITITAISLFIFFYKDISSLMLVSLAFITGGGIGNMIDRIAKGAVVDFFNFEFIDFPVFNVADIFVTVGAILLIAELLIFDMIRQKRKKKQDQDLYE